MIEQTNKVNYNIPFYERSARKVIFSLFLMFIPFSQALTINVLFPLKISEIFLIILIILEVKTGDFLSWRLSKLTMNLLLLFLFSVFVSVVINIFYKYDYELTLSYSRITPTVDTILKFFYVIIAFAGLFVTRNILKDDETLIKYFFIGASLSALYAWYLFFSGVLKLPGLLLPGMGEDSQTYDAGFGETIRSGTFKEGNYMGFFMLVSAIIAIYYNKGKLSLFYFLSIITTFSTTAIFCSIVFAVVYFFYRYKKYKLKLIFIFLSIITVLILLIQFSPGFQTLFYNKIFGNEDTVENANDIYSKAERLNTTLVALDIAQNNPFFGVGPANYGLHYNHYNSMKQFAHDIKHIPNNIYVEILSECGAFSLIAFLFFLGSLFNYGGGKSPILRAGLIAAFIYFFAFPTFTMLFIWVFIGIILI
jgi:O-antigen ligase